MFDWKDWRGQSTGSVPEGGEGCDSPGSKDAGWHDGMTVVAVDVAVRWKWTEVDNG